MLAYTNRFLAVGNLVRNLHKQYEKDHDATTLSQIHTLKHRLRLIRDMQICGVLSLISCVGCMALIYINKTAMAHFVFGLSLLLLAGSLFISVYEIILSTKALNLQLKNLEEEETDNRSLKEKLFPKS